MSLTNLKPYDLLIEDKVPDGQGGFLFTETGTTVVYLNVRYHDNILTVTARAEEVIAVNKKIRIDGALYRVQGVHQVGEGKQKKLDLERILKPEVPV